MSETTLSYEKQLEVENRRLRKTLRDEFAAKAMQARISNSEIGIDETPKEIAEAAYAQADAMLQEREL